MSEAISLEDQLALTLDSMMKTQEALQSEREGWAKERTQFLQEMERERAAFGKLRQELGQSVQESAQRSVGRLVQLSAEALSKSVGEKLRAQVGAQLVDAESSLLTAAKRGKAAAEQLQQLSQDLKGNWKTALQRTAWQTVPAVLVFFFIGWLVVLWAQWGVWEAKMEAAKAYQETEEWNDTNANLLNEYRRMKVEMDKWKAAGIGQVELRPCSGGNGLCVLVDKKQGAFGDKKNLYVPGSTYVSESGN